MQPGDVLASRYELLELLGEGRIGQVFRAAERGADQHVAIKFPHAGHHRNPEFAARFRREHLTGMRLTHPAIVRSLDTGDHQGVPFLVMELVEGLPLERWFASTGRDFEALAEVLDQSLDALAYAHAHRVVHRELKPANVLVTPEGHPRLLDFGLAGRLEDQLARTGDGRDLGLAYLSPEQAMGERGDERSDLYSFGACLYHLVAERPLFEATGAADLLLAHLNEHPVPLSSLRTAVPIWLDRLVLRLLAKHPDRRPQSAVEVQSWIRRRRLPRTAPVRQPEPMLGRERELEKLAASVKRLKSGRSSIWRVFGPAGVGKTRLADAVLELAEHQGCGSLRIAAPAGEDLYLGLVTRALGRGYGSVAERFEERTVDRPLLVIFDDFHQADPVVAGLLEELAAGLKGVSLMLLVLDRPGARHEATRLVLDKLPQQLELTGLDRDTCARLVEDKIWASPPPEATAWLHRVTDGNPQFLKLLLERLEGTHLQVLGGQASWNPPIPAETPSDLDDLVTRNLEREGREVADLLGVGACLGEWFEFNLLKAMVLQEESSLEQTLERLVRIGSLREEWESGVVAYRFADKVLWAAALRRVDERRQRRIHLLAAAFLERSGNVSPARLARHYQQAGEAGSSLRHLARALAESLEREEFGEARYWFKRCQAQGQEAPAGLAADRIFPEPWSNFGWTGLAEDTGHRHFLAAQWIALGQPEEALWQLQIAWEQGLEDDPHRLVENQLLRVVSHLRTGFPSAQEAEEALHAARSQTDSRGWQEQGGLVAVLGAKLMSGREGL